MGTHTVWKLVSATELNSQLNSQFRLCFSQNKWELRDINRFLFNINSKLCVKKTELWVMNSDLWVMQNFIAELTCDSYFFSQDHGSHGQKSSNICLPPEYIWSVADMNNLTRLGHSVCVCVCVCVTSMCALKYFSVLSFKRVAMFTNVCPWL